METLVYNEAISQCQTIIEKCILNAFSKIANIGDNTYKPYTFPIFKLIDSHKDPRTKRCTKWLDRLQPFTDIYTGDTSKEFQNLIKILKNICAGGNSLNLTDITIIDNDNAKNCLGKRNFCPSVSIPLS